MKKEILEKLYSDQPLDREEIIFVANSLKDKGEDLQYNHELDGTLPACGLTEQDFNDFNDLFKISRSKNGEEVNFSRLVEEVEAISKGNPKYERLIAMQAVRHTLEIIKRQEIMRIIGGK